MARDGDEGLADKVKSETPKKVVALYRPSYSSNDPNDVFRKAIQEGYCIEDFFIADVIHRDSLSNQLIVEKSKAVISLRKRKEIVDDSEEMIV